MTEMERAEPVWVLVEERVAESVDQVLEDLRLCRGALQHAMAENGRLRSERDEAREQRDDARAQVAR